LVADPQYDSYSLNHHAYRARGRYCEQLERFYQHFDATQVLVLLAEDLFGDPQSVVGQTVDFLQLPCWPPQEPGPNDMAAGSANMSPAAHDQLADYFSPHNRELAKLLGRSLPWVMK